MVAGTAILLSLVFLVGCRDRLESAGGLEGTGLPRWDELIRVSDGDTVVIRYHDFPLAVRLLGVDTAESVHPDAVRNTAFGDKTAAWAKQTLQGRRIRVECIQRGGLIAIDRHHRALGWLWVEGRDGGMELFNETLVEQGWSRFVDFEGDAKDYADRLRAAESIAKDGQRGLWARNP